MEQNRLATKANHLPSIFTYIAVVLVVTFSQERWDSWDLLVGVLGICAFAATFRLLGKGDKLEHFCNSLLLGLSVYVILCSLSVLLGFLVIPGPEPAAPGFDTPLTGKQVEALLRRYLTVPRCVLEDWWWVIVFGVSAAGFVLSSVCSKESAKPNQSMHPTS